MNKLKGSLLKFGYIEKLANGDSLIHRLNPLLKIILALMYLSLIHISEPTRQAEISYAVFCLKKKKKNNNKKQKQKKHKEDS